MGLKRLMSATASAALLAGAAQAEAPGTPAANAATDATVSQVVAPAGDIVETMTASGQFTILIKGLEATNLTELLKTTSNLTLFAPTDAAFSALPDGELDRLMAMENRAELQKLLTHHLVNARIDGAKIDNARGPVPTVAGETLQVDGVDETWMIGEAKIIQADINAENGVIHVVDKVLMPSSITTTTEGAQSGAVNSPQAMNAATSGQGMMPQMHDEAPSAAGAGSLASGSEGVEVTTHGPIPDTQENRAKYGGPQSRAGKASNPSGN